MYIPSTLRSRSNLAANGSSGGGVGVNTIIFIIVGVVCLLVILTGFYFVSRPRAASNAAPSLPSTQPQHSPPVIHSSPPASLRPERDIGKRWKIWNIWRRSSPKPLIIVETPTSEVLPAPATITTPPQCRSIRSGSKTYPPIISRPSQPRRVTSLSVTTSFSHSHITQEELNTFRLSAYDLDDDLETEMLNSATDDVWPGQVLAVEEGCGSVGVLEGAIEARGNASANSGGSVEGYGPPRLTTTQWRGGDYENLGSQQGVAAGNDGDGGGVVEVDKVAMGRQACQ